MTIVVFPFFLNCGQMPGGTDWENKTKGSTIRKFQVILDQSTAERVIATEISGIIEQQRGVIIKEQQRIVSQFSATLHQ